MKTALETQVGGSHYKDMPIQTIEFSMANSLNACQHSVVKYVCRYKQKGGIADLEKAKHCIDLLIEFERKAGPQAANDNAKDETYLQRRERLMRAGECKAGSLATLCDKCKNMHGKSCLAVHSEHRKEWADAGGWIAWGGGENPVPGRVVEVTHAGGWNSSGISDGFWWERRVDSGDIIRYRLAP